VHLGEPELGRLTKVLDGLLDVLAVLAKGEAELSGLLDRGVVAAAPPSQVKSEMCSPIFMEPSRLEADADSGSWPP